MTVTLVTAIQRWVGLSADAKPTTGVAAGSRFTERDTSREYIWDGTAWAALAFGGDTANGLDVDVTRLAALSAGSNLIGKVGIDQTTPGTTNKVVADPVTATLTIYTVTLTLANTEYSQALPANCRGFDLQPRTNVDVRWSNVTGKVAGSVEPFMTMKSGAGYSSPPLNQGASPSTIYLASSTAGTVVEIVAYS